MNPCAIDITAAIRSGIGEGILASKHRASQHCLSAGCAGKDLPDCHLLKASA
jgi:hypothetical protein